MDCFKLGKGVCWLHVVTCLFNFSAEYSVQNESQAGIKIARRNINKLRYADDTTPMAESKKELKRLMKAKESEKAGLKLNVQKPRS